MPLCRHSITFTVCVRDRQTAKSCFEQVLVTMRNAFALRQEQCGCSRFHSFPCSFVLEFVLCESAAAASFVQVSYIYIYIAIFHIQYEFPEGFPTFIVW